MIDRIHFALSQLHRRLVGTPAIPFTSPDTHVTRILFVCMANICRSPIAQCVAKRVTEEKSLSLAFEFDSAGTVAGLQGAPIDPRARQIAAQRGYALIDHRARRVTIQDFVYFDLLLAMDNDNLAVLNKMCPQQYAHKPRLFLAALNDPGRTEVPDPYYGSLVGFERVFDLCESAMEALLIQHRPLP